MENLWAPWRMEYIRSDKSGECIFCTGPEAGDDREKKILYRGQHSFVVINIYPYSNGHLMVSPYRHVDCVTGLNNDELVEMARLIQESTAILRQSSNPDGFNIGYNIGKSGGAGFDAHIHAHIVPRWTGDVNFMAVLEDVKVIPEHLEETYDRLLPLFQNLTL